jgi:hypothetical protein
VLRSRSVAVCIAFKVIAFLNRLTPSVHTLVLESIMLLTEMSIRNLAAG